MRLRRILQLATIALVPVSASAQVVFTPLKEEVIVQRVTQAKKKNVERKQALFALFTEAGCADALVEQPVKGSKIPNVVCTLKGETDAVIVVGAHFDKTDEGLGVVDNWSGASLLPSLFQSLKDKPRKHTFVFVGFTDEEKGLVGSRDFVKQWPKADLPNIRAMVNLDTLGLGETAVWVSHADKVLVDAIATMGAAMSLPVTGVNVELVGSSDSESFREKKVAAVTLHSLTQETLEILHSRKDDLTALKKAEYYRSYRLIAGYLAYLDGLLTPKGQ